MKRLLLFVSILTAFTVHGATTAFIRPIVSVIQTSTQAYGSSTGIGVCGGVCLGDKGQHEVSLETDYTSWGFDTRVGNVRVNGDEKYQLFVVNYRYHFVFPSHEKLNFYAGPSLGFVVSTLSVTASGYGSATSTSSSASWGVGAGAIYRVTDHIDIDVGYRNQYIVGTSYAVHGYTYTTENTTVGAVYAGIGFRF